MKSSSPQIEHLKLMLSLEEKRSALVGELTALEAQLTDLKQRLVSGSPVASAPKVTASKPAPQAQPKVRAKRSGRGELKNQIFAALEKAGASGLKVLDLAKSLGTKPANIYAWFHAAVKRYPNVKKMDGGTYRLAGKAPAAESSPAKAPAKAASKTAAKPAAKAPVKAAAPAAKGKAKAKGGVVRGEVSARIIAALQAAGAGGIAIKDLSAKLGMPYRNLQVWFATTGKKQKGIKKIKPATYSMK